MGFTKGAECFILAGMDERAPLFPDPERKTLAKGVKISLEGPTIVLLSVNAKDRVPWIGQAVVQRSLENVWRAADAWLVGYYLLMPDHLHLFCAPRDLRFTIEAWVKYWRASLAGRIWTSLGLGSGVDFITASAARMSFMRSGSTCRRIPFERDLSLGPKIGRIREQSTKCGGKNVPSASLINLGGGPPTKTSVWEAECVRPSGFWRRRFVHSRGDIWDDVEVVLTVRLEVQPGR